MDGRAAVVLMGDSVLMDALAVGLQEELAFTVVRMQNSASDLQERLNATDPNLIVYALDGPSAPAVLTLVGVRPETILLSIDHSSSEVTVTTSKRYPVGSIQEFCRLARTQLASHLGIRKGGEQSNQASHAGTAETD
jgi:hypothetical protein